MANGFILGASLSHVAGHDCKCERKLVFSTLLMLLCVVLAPLVKAACWATVLFDCFWLQETEFPAEGRFKIWGLLSRLTSAEAGWFQGCLTQWLDHIKTLESS